MSFTASFLSYHFPLNFFNKNKAMDFHVKQPHYDGKQLRQRVTRRVNEYTADMILKYEHAAWCARDIEYPPVLGSEPYVLNVSHPIGVGVHVIG